MARHDVVNDILALALLELGSEYKVHSGVDRTFKTNIYVSSSFFTLFIMVRHDQFKQSVNKNYYRSRASVKCTYYEYRNTF